MSTAAADALRDFVAALLPAPGWRLQFGKWLDGTVSDRYAVIRPVGGLPADLVREPQFTLTLIGAKNEGTGPAGAAADLVIKAMKASSGALVFMNPGEPVFVPTSDDRATFEIAIATITN